MTRHGIKEMKKALSNRGRETKLPSTRMLKKGLKALFANGTLIGIVTVYLLYQNNQLSVRNQDLQNMIYNYPPLVFAYPKYEVVVSLGQLQPWGVYPNGELDLVVVIVTPHNGYAFVNRTFFTIFRDSYTEDLLDPRSLSDVAMYRECIFAVPAGSLQITLKILFYCDVGLKANRMMPGYSGMFYLGEIGLRVVFHDVQTDKFHSILTKANVRVNYKY